jgi:hypothetical protein
MLKMKWMTDHDGRLVATWTQSNEPGPTGGREETIMIQMKWAVDLWGCLVTTPAQSPIANSGLRLPRLVRPCFMATRLVSFPFPSSRRSIRYATQRFFHHKGFEGEI